MMGFEKWKIRFWIIGTTISLTGAFIFRFELLTKMGFKSDINTIIGLMLAFSGLFVITLATRKKRK